MGAAYILQWAGVQDGGGGEGVMLCLAQASQRAAPPGVVRWSGGLAGASKAAADLCCGAGVQDSGASWECTQVPMHPALQLFY